MVSTTKWRNYSKDTAPGNGKNTKDRMNGSALGGMHSCYVECQLEMGCVGHDPSGFCDKTCKNKCGGR